jgi:hypothetical protein
MSKACQYVINDNKIPKGSMQMSVTDAEVPLQKNNYMGKRFWEREAREKVCIESGMQL